MSKVKNSWNSEKVLSISAISISFITLVIFIFQTNLLVNQTKLLSEQNFLAILPYLSLSTSDDGIEDYVLTIDNNGVGPAIIESVILTYQDKQIDLEDHGDSLFEFMISTAPALDSLDDVSSSTLNKGLAIPANTTYTLMSVKDNAKEYKILTDQLNALLNDGLTYVITFKSIQRERWRITATSYEPEKLD